MSSLKEGKGHSSMIVSVPWEQQMKLRHHLSSLSLAHLQQYVKLCNLRKLTLTWRSQHQQSSQQILHLNCHLTLGQLSPLLPVDWLSPARTQSWELKTLEQKGQVLYELKMLIEPRTRHKAGGRGEALKEQITITEEWTNVRRKFQLLSCEKCDKR